MKTSMCVIVLFLIGITSVGHAKNNKTKLTNSTENEYSCNKISMSDNSIVAKYVGINPFQLFNYLKSHQGILIKNEFETTNDYQARFKELMETKMGKGYLCDNYNYGELFTFHVPHNSIRYDADKGVMTVDISVNKSYRPELFLELQEGISSYEYSEVKDVRIAKYFVDKINGKKTIRNFYSMDLSLMIKSRSLYISDIEMGAHFNVPIEKAKDAKKNGILLISGNLRPPFIVSDEFVSGGYYGKISGIKTIHQSVVINPIIIIFYNYKTGEIYEKNKFNIN